MNVHALNVWYKHVLYANLQLHVTPSTVSYINLLLYIGFSAILWQCVWNSISKFQHSVLVCKPVQQISSYYSIMKCNWSPWYAYDAKML